MTQWGQIALPNQGDVAAEETRLLCLVLPRYTFVTWSQALTGQLAAGFTSRRHCGTMAGGAHELSSINTLLAVAIIGLSVVAGYLIKKYKCFGVPESALTMLVSQLGQRPTQPPSFGIPEEPCCMRSWLPFVHSLESSLGALLASLATMRRSWPTFRSRCDSAAVQQQPVGWHHPGAGVAGTTLTPSRPCRRSRKCSSSFSSPPSSLRLATL